MSSLSRYKNKHVSPWNRLICIENGISKNRIFHCEQAHIKRINPIGFFYFKTSLKKYTWVTSFVKIRSNLRIARIIDLQKVPRIRRWSLVKSNYVV